MYFPAHGAEALRRINVVADPSLSPALAELVRRYASANGVALSVEFTSTDVLNSDSEEEVLDVDVLITSRSNVIDSLTMRGMVDVYSKTPITANRLCFATRADNPLKLILIPRLPLAGILRKLDPDFAFIIGDPNWLYSGNYALQALRFYEMAGELEPNFLFLRSNADMQSEMTKPGAYGIMHCSEVIRNPDLDIRGIFEEDSHSPIIYYAVAVAGEQMETARNFITWLKGETTQAVFKAYGFVTPESVATLPAATERAVP